MYCGQVGGFVPVRQSMFLFTHIKRLKAYVKDQVRLRTFRVHFFSCNNFPGNYGAVLVGMSSKNLV